jgi:FKBP-type peptidyl-prolyl cis-trans isomerase 2
VRCEPKDAYGDYEDDNVATVPMSNMPEPPEGLKMEPGMVMQVHALPRSLYTLCRTTPILCLRFLHISTHISTFRQLTQAHTMLHILDERCRNPKLTMSSISQQLTTGQIAVITEVNEDTVTLDGNHPLAGKTLNFEVKLGSIMVRDTLDSQTHDLRPSSPNPPHTVVRY